MLLAFTLPLDWAVTEPPDAMRISGAAREMLEATRC